MARFRFVPRKRLDKGCSTFLVSFSFLEVLDLLLFACAPLAEAAKKERAKRLKLEAKKLKNQKKMQVGLLLCATRSYSKSASHHCTNRSGLFRDRVQEWRATKARREWEAIEAEEAAREEYAKQDIEKQKQYIARSKAAKKRLKALKARKDAEEEAERQRQGALTVD